ncbi:MAG: peptidoglycan-associated lipoprotein Pal [Pseudomonadales bacterium]
MKNKLMSVSTSIVKKSVFLAIVVSFLASCASNQQQADADAAAAAAAEAAAAAAVASGAESVEVSIDTAANLDSVFYFEYDQSSLTSAARAALDAQAAALRGGVSDVRLEGHADERGSREYNLALGERRAKAVADYLAIQGVSRSRIEVVSYGEERPVSLRSDDSAYSLNRRVELK